MTPAEFQAILTEARRQHQAGRLKDAESLYRQVLAEGERDDVLAALAQVLFQLGDANGATELLYRAVDLKPDNFEYLANLGMVLATGRRFDQAIEFLRKAIALRPDSPELLNNLGAALKEMNQLDEAIDIFQRAISMRPEYAEAHYNLGVALQQQLKWEPAKAEFEQAVLLRQNYLPALINLGAVLLKLDQPQAAEAAYRQALEINADHADAWYGLGGACQQTGRNEDAIGHYRKALALRPDFADAAYNIGKAAVESGHSDEAIAHFQKARTLRPELIEASNNLAIALQEKEQWDEALHVLREAQRVKPNSASIHINLGNIFQDLGRFDKALEEHRKALELDPDNALAMWNKAMVLLATGQLKEGFEAYEARLRVKDLIPDPDYGKPKWDGSDLDGRTILIHAEQGYGDTIQFVRYIPMIHDRGGRVILQCPRPLHPLLKAQLPLEQLLGGGDPLPQFDVHCSLPSLPHRFGTTLQNIPARVPYLMPDEARVARWRERLVQEPGKLKVGLAWAGNPSHRQDKHRSLPFAALARLFDLHNIRFFSLQKGSAAEELRSASDKSIPNRKTCPEPACTEHAEGVEGSQIANIVDWTSDLNDFADTAALIANLDLVIAVDTVVVHLAGALAKPAWVLLAVPTDWRWMLELSDSPWYPTLRLFRQPRRRDWRTPIEQVTEELKRLLSSASPADASKK